MSRCGVSTDDQATIDEAEIARFSALAEKWWDPRGKMAVLHKFNPVRLAYIRDAALQALRARSEAARLP